MSLVTNYIDLSTKSLVIAGVIFLVVVFVTKYLFDKNTNEEEDKRSIYLTMTYCVLLGLVFAGLTLVLYKQFCKFGACDILTEPFPSKTMS